MEADKKNDPSPSMNARLRRLATNVFSAGLDPGAVTPQIYLQAQTISVAIIVAVVTSFGFAIFCAEFSPLLGWVHIASGIFLTCGYLYFRHDRNPVIVTRVCCACAFAVTMSVNWVYGGLGSPAIAWFILPAVASALVLGWRDGWFWILIGCLFTTAMFAFDRYVGLPPTSVPPEYQTLATYLYCLSLAVVIGVFFSFSVERNRRLEVQFNASVVKSEKDAYLAGLFADSAIAANGSLDFEQAASVCLEMLCNAEGWCVAHIWLANGEAGLVSSGIWHVEVGSYRFALARAKTAAEQQPAGISACIAVDTASPIVGFDCGEDPRFDGWRDSQLSSVLPRIRQGTN